MDLPGLNTYHKEPYAAISPTLPALTQKGKTVLITGGSEGIGLAIAKAFVAASAMRVIILARRTDKVQSAAVELGKEATATDSPTVSEGRVCDISDLESTASLWTQLADEGIFVDVLVLNACAPGAIKPLLEIGRDDVWQDFNTNVRSNLDFTERFYKQKGQGAGGRKVLVGVSTVAVYLWNTVRDRPSYGLTKNAGALVLQQFARDVKPEDMQVSIFHPGAVLTSSAKKVGVKESQYRFDHVDLPGRFAVWAATPEAEFLHGRFVWANWDVDELKGDEFRKQLEENPNFLTVGIEGLSESKHMPVL